jgi:hypothetical protein
MYDKINIAIARANTTCTCNNLSFTKKSTFVIYAVLKKQKYHSLFKEWYFFI